MGVGKWNWQQCGRCSSHIVKIVLNEYKNNNDNSNDYYILSFKSEPSKRRKRRVESFELLFTLHYEDY